MAKSSFKSLVVGQINRIFPNLKLSSDLSESELIDKMQTAEAQAGPPVKPEPKTELSDLIDRIKSIEEDQDTEAEMGSILDEMLADTKDEDLKKAIGLVSGAMTSDAKPDADPEPEGGEDESLVLGELKTQVTELTKAVTLMATQMAKGKVKAGDVTRQRKNAGLMEPKPDDEEMTKEQETKVAGEMLGALMAGGGVIQDPWDKAFTGLKKVGL